jgi:UDP:flavonoid glycosyltransferase YjiC (YdhE family)
VTARREDVPADLPDGMRHLPYVPFSHLLPRAAALVCHGGIGTVAQGLRSGAPQLVVPMAHDQHDNGSRLVDLGAGESLDLARYAPGTAAPILDRLMRDPAVRARCAELAGLLRGDDALGAAAAAIEGAVA